MTDRDSSLIYDQDYKNYQLRRSSLRKFISQFYLKNRLKYVKGNAVDFGCGIGELLRRLPANSIGFDVNEAAVKHCKEIGLNVETYEPEIDNYQFKCIKKGEFKTFVICHVLEHLEEPGKIVRLILKSCSCLGIERIVIIVPGMKGFKFDSTHNTFIDISYFERFKLGDIEDYAISLKRYFPVNFSWVGRYFNYNELIVVFDKKSDKNEDVI